MIVSSEPSDTSTTTAPTWPVTSEMTSDLCQYEWFCRVLTELESTFVKLLHKTMRRYKALSDDNMIWSICELMNMSKPRLSVSQTDSVHRIKSQMLKLSELNSYLHLQDEVTVFLSE